MSGRRGECWPKEMGCTVGNEETYSTLAHLEFKSHINLGKKSNWWPSYFIWRTITGGCAKVLLALEYCMSFGNTYTYASVMLTIIIVKLLK